MKILYVCTGNICRSPLAEAVTRHEALKRGLYAGVLETESAGTQGYHQGDPPDPRSVDVASRVGISMKGQRARKLVAGDFDRFDLILAMDRGHLDHLRRAAPPGSKAQIELFMLYAAGVEQDVPDPYYGDIEDFLAVRHMLMQGVDQVFSKLEKLNDFNMK